MNVDSKYEADISPSTKISIDLLKIFSLDWAILANPAVGVEAGGDGAVLDGGQVPVEQVEVVRAGRADDAPNARAAVDVVVTDAGEADLATEGGGAFGRNSVSILGFWTFEESQN